MELVSRKIALDGQLKPEVRLGQAISEFLYALDEGKRNEFRNIQATSSRRLSGTDVMMLTEEINKAGLRQNRCFKPHGTRIYSFLSRLQTFASVGDVLIGGSQNLIATGVWSALRFCLLGAVNFLGYFEKISTLLMRLGTSWSLHERFAQIFPQSQYLQRYLCEYLIVLLKLCRSVISFTQKSLASQLLSTLGTSFDEEFGPLQKELDQWGFLIQKGAEQTAMEVNIDLGVQLREHNITLKRLFSGEAKRRSHAFKCQVLQDLSPGQSQYEMCWRRQRGKGSCKWIFETQGYQDWNSMETSTVFMVEGKLGSGKTVAMANLVTDMNTASKGPCAYFFCTFKEPESLNAINVLRSIAFHFLDGMRIEDISWDKVFDEKGVPLPRLSSPDAIVDILLDLLPKKPKYSVVLDGVDDCPDDEIYDIFKALHRLMQNRVVLVCYSARTDSRFRHIAGRELGSSFSATLDDEAHDEEMRAFIDQEILRRNKSQDLDADLLSIVINQLVTGSQGMYLWVSLQLDAIFPSNSKTVVTNERIFNLVMNLPRDLPEAFERALGGIIDKSYEEKIFKLVMAAESPLTIDEMRIALAITPGNVLWDPHKIPRDGEQLIALCGGDILELDEEDSRVRFIHHSVIQHLLSPAMRPSTRLYHFSLEEAHNFTGSVCVTYLNIPDLGSQIAMTQPLDAKEVPQRSMMSVQREEPTLSRIVQLIKSSKRAPERSFQLDLARLALDAQRLRPRYSLGVHAFKKYALVNWFIHTRFFRSDDESLGACWDLWWHLLSGHVAQVKPHFSDQVQDSQSALIWASEHQHGGLFLSILTNTGPDNTSKLNLQSFLDLFVSLSTHGSIRDQWLGDIVAQIVEAVTNDVFAFKPRSLGNKIDRLVSMGASPTKPHHLTGLSPMRILMKGFTPRNIPIVDKAFETSFVSIIKNLCSIPEVRRSLQENWVPQAMIDLISRRQSEAIALSILKYRPNIRTEAPMNSVLGAAVLFEYIETSRTLVVDWNLDPTKHFYGSRSAVQISVENRNQELRKILCTYRSKTPQ